MPALKRARVLLDLSIPPRRRTSWTLCEPASTRWPFPRGTEPTPRSVSDDGYRRSVTLAVDSESAAGYLGGRGGSRQVRRWKDMNRASLIALLLIAAACTGGAGPQPSQPSRP